MLRPVTADEWTESLLMSVKTRFDRSFRHVPKSAFRASPDSGLMNFKDRVQAHTDDAINARIEAEARARVLADAGATAEQLTRHIEDLEKEWDIERFLEMNASALALTGVVLGLLWNRKFFLIPCLVLPFLFHHAIRGWCPPIPFLRRRGIRTRREIDLEKYAIKALRGDFAAVHPDAIDPKSTGRKAWDAADS